MSSIARAYYKCIVISKQSCYQFLKFGCQSRPFTYTNTIVHIPALLAELQVWSQSVTYFGSIESLQQASLLLNLVMSI